MVKNNNLDNVYQIKSVRPLCGLTVKNTEITKKDNVIEYYICYPSIYISLSF